MAPQSLTWSDECYRRAPCGWFLRQRLEAEHHRLREEQLRRAEVRLKERLRRLTPAWRSIQYSTEEDLALRAAARRQEERQRRREHGVLMRHMLHRVHTIPTLFERQSAVSARRAPTPDLLLLRS